MNEVDERLTIAMKKLVPCSFACAMLAAMFVSAEPRAVNAQTPQPIATPVATPVPQTPAATSPQANPSDVASADAIVAALYDVISGPAGKKRDWNRMRSLFIPQGRLIPIVPREGGGFGVRVLSVEDYVNSSGNYLETNGFFEREVSHKDERYENLVHRFSAYESRHKANDATPFARGTNSIQLMFDGTRWWVITVAWDSEKKK